MKQFKVGDSVRLKKNLKVGKSYGGLDFWEFMNFNDRKAISEVTCTGVTVMLESSPFYYHFDMLTKEKP